MLKIPIAGVIGLLFAALSTASCYQDGKTSAQQETRLKKKISQEELLTLRRNETPLHTGKNSEAIAKIPKGYKFAQPGYFTVAVGAHNSPPLYVLAEDNKTFIGSEVDIAQLIADSLGLKLKIIPTSWENWPLGLASGKFDAVFSNIAVTEERKRKYDFATYREDTLAFYVAENNKIQAIKSASDISGLKIVVGSGTNQERLLLRWIEENKNSGKPPAQPIYLDEGAAVGLALQSGRVDAHILPSSTGLWQQNHGASIREAGHLDGNWSVAAALKKGTGLVDAVQEAINGSISTGAYQKALSRWHLEKEGVRQSFINPAVQNN